MTLFEKDEFFKIIKSINAALGEHSVENSVLRSLFDQLGMV